MARSQGRSSRTDGLNEITEAELRQQSESDSDYDLTPQEIAELEALKNAESLKKELEETRRELSRVRARAAAERLERLVYVDIVGGGSNATIHPGDNFDLVVGANPAQLLANTKATFGDSNASFPDGLIAFIPVRIWPIAVQPTEQGVLGIKGRPFLPFAGRSGQPPRNLIVGQTRVQQSYMAVTILLDGHKIPVSLTAMATINVNPFQPDPNRVADSLDRSASWERYSKVGADTNRDTDTPSTMDEPAFIPSLVPHTRSSTGPKGSEQGRSEPTGSPNDNVIDGSTTNNTPRT